MRDLKKKVAIFGGGAGGVGAALAIAQRYPNFSVMIFEKNDDLLLGTSNATPGRAGHGFHYIHPETGILYLKATIDVVRQYPECMLGYQLPEDHHLRHGLYFIMKMKKDLSKEDEKFASLFSKEAILKTYEQLREAYRTLIEEDPKNKVFGEPEQFFKEEDLDQYKSIVDTSKIDAVVNTREELVNWPKLRKTLIDQIEKTPNITVYRNSTIRSPSYSPAGYPDFRFYANNLLVHAHYIINTTWEEIEYIDDQMGFKMMENARTNRLKTIVTVELPKALQTSPSMFFCMGPHAMFSNMGNGRGMTTYAPETNIKSVTSLCIDDDMKKCLERKQSLQERNNKAKRVVNGLSRYIPIMKNAEVIDTGFGIIKTDGKVDIFDPNSNFHRRDKLGVKQQQTAWISNSCMKLLYFMVNAKKVAELLEEHVIANQAISTIKDTVLNEVNLSEKADISRMLEIHLQRNFIGEDLQITKDEIAKKMKKSMELKSRLFSTSNKRTLETQCDTTALLSLEFFERLRFPLRMLLLLYIALCVFDEHNRNPDNRRRSSMSSFTHKTQKTIPDRAIELPNDKFITSPF